MDVEHLIADIDAEGRRFGIRFGAHPFSPFDGGISDATPGCGAGHLINVTTSSTPRVGREGSGDEGGAEKALTKTSKQRFKGFRAEVTFVEEAGKFYDNGDTPIRNEKLLREFWEQYVGSASAVTETKGPVPEFVAITVGGIVQIRNAATRHALTCP